ncbi:MAG: AbrB/MazE/SpoVT family DNA-binding domain-containing protein [Armatimonadetes bacterium]|nr:AbrB/MazE/SpoVT family DNA-binding domain-containing protein [Armatimonadota bacterium]
MKCHDYFYGSVTVGERGQIVIPAEARAELNIQAGDKLLVMRHPIYEGLMVSKIDAVSDFVEEFRQSLDRMIEQVEKAEKESEEKAG